MLLEERPRLKIIENDREHQVALEAIKTLMGSEIAQGTEDENYLEVLSLLVEKHEEESEYKLDSSQVDAVDVISYYLAENGLKQKDLVPVLGPAGRVSEIMNRKRELSLKQIQNLSRTFSIPLGLLMNQAN